MALMECLRQSEIILLIYRISIYTIIIIICHFLAYTENISFFSFTTILT